MVELDSVKFDLNDLEQYGRRSSIRLNNYNPSVNSTDEVQLTKSVTHFLNESVLKGSRSLQIREIERCHVVGKSKGGRPKQIIIKFAHYQDKRRVFATKSSQRKSIKNLYYRRPDKLQSLYGKTASVAKKGNKIDSFWTSDGRVLVKKDAVSDPIYVSPRVSIFEKLGVKIVADEPAVVEPARTYESLENLNLPVNRLILMIYSPAFYPSGYLLLKLSCRC